MSKGLERRDLHPISLQKNDILFFSIIRNERLRLPFLLKYYRQLGVTRFFFVNNQSEDTSEAFLLSQPDVHLFHCEDSYASANCGICWYEQLLQTYAVHRWCVIADADELFTYPGCEKVGLAPLTQSLSSRGEEAMYGLLLDLYSDKLLSQTFYQEEDSPLSHCSWFDTDSYTVLDRPGNGLNGYSVLGGVRARAFNLQPCLNKVPLLYYKRCAKLFTGMHAIENLSMANRRGTVLHFKFFSDFFEKAAREAQREEHWNNAIEYHQYLKYRKSWESNLLYHSRSKKYENSHSPVHAGLIPSWESH